MRLNTIKLAISMYLFYRYGYTGSVDFFKPKKPDHGDISTAVAFKVSKQGGEDPLEVATELSGYIRFLINSKTKY